MKRSRLQRKTPLQRSSGELQRSAGLARTNGLERKTRKRKASIPPALRQIAAARSGGLCIVCDCDERQIVGTGGHFEWHHVFDEQLFPELATVEANLVLVCDSCHARHTNAFQRISRKKLPTETILLAAGNGPRLNFLERTYPV